MSEAFDKIKQFVEDYQTKEDIKPVIEMAGSKGYTWEDYQKLTMFDLLFDDKTIKIHTNEYDGFTLKNNIPEKFVVKLETLKYRVKDLGKRAINEGNKSTEITKNHYSFVIDEKAIQEQQGGVLTVPSVLAYTGYGTGGGKLIITGQEVIPARDFVNDYHFNGDAHDNATGVHIWKAINTYKNSVAPVENARIKF